MLEALLEQRGDSAWILLEGRPLFNEKGVLRSKDATYILTPADVTPWLHRLSMVVLALVTLDGLPESYAGEVAALLLEQRSSGGFGSPAPALESTYWVVEGLKALGRLAPMPETARWVLECENESGGFSASPSSRNYFVENLYYGLETLRALGSAPKHSSSHARYISSLQNANGGFRRAPTHGVSSLEYTFYAIRSLELLGLL